MRACVLCLIPVCAVSLFARNGEPVPSLRGTGRDSTTAEPVPSLRGREAEPVLALQHRARLSNWRASPTGTHPVVPGSQPVAADAAIPADWKAMSPRDEIRPKFGYDPAGGPKKAGAFVITADERDGLHGWFQKSFPVKGGTHYHFHAVRKCQNVAVPRRSASVRVLWQDDSGKPVKMSEPPVKGYLKGGVGNAEAEHPTDHATDANGWTEVSDTYCAPAAATRAVVELHLLWASNGKIEWSDVSFAEVPAPAPRKRLAKG